MDNPGTTTITFTDKQGHDATLMQISYTEDNPTIAIGGFLALYGKLYGTDHALGILDGITYVLTECREDIKDMIENADLDDSVAKVTEEVRK